MWIFSILFDVSDVEATLEQAILDQAPPAPPSRERSFDVAIDAQHGTIQVGEQNYYASELLFTVDYAAYRDLGERLSNSMADSNADSEENNTE